MNTSGLYITGDTVGNFFHWLSSVFSGIVSLFTNTQPVITIIGVPLYKFDILLMVSLAGLVVFYFVIYERFTEVKSGIQKNIDTLYLKPSVHEIKNARWERITSLIHTASDSDWKLAIIEADTMLDDLLTTLGYPGSTMSEKLKQVHINNFPTINDAWNAHTVRNRIAHEGSNFVLNQRDALQVYYLYEKIFKDAHYI